MGNECCPSEGGTTEARIARGGEGKKVINSREAGWFFEKMQIQIFNVPLTDVGESMAEVNVFWQVVSVNADLQSVFCLLKGFSIHHYIIARRIGMAR